MSVGGKTPKSKAISRPSLTQVSVAGGGEAVARHNANSRAYSLLKQAVLSGSFRPSQTITLRMATELLGLGEMPAREALKRIISEGGFEAIPNRSARVPLLNHRDITQLSELRVLLESNAAFLAAQNITLRQIEQLEGMHQGMIEAIGSGDVNEYKRLNMAFHFEIYRIADNKPLSNLIESLWLRMAPVISRTISEIQAIPGRFDEIANGNHEKLLEAFQLRDAEGARTAMRLDLSDIQGTRRG